MQEKRAINSMKAEQFREVLDPQMLVSALLDLGNKADKVAIEDLPRLKFQAEILTTILKKCMPDLRSLEVKENDSKHATLIIDMKR